jgi:F-type H+-transporting ATPase subunit epsilon
MEEKLTLAVVIPKRQMVSDVVDSVEIPSESGYMGILPGHAALITKLGYGVLSFTSGEKKNHIALHGGLVEVLPGFVRVLADSAEWAENVDFERAQKALDRATSMIQNQEIEVDMARATRSIRRAEARLETVRRSSETHG